MAHFNLRGYGIGLDLETRGLGIKAINQVALPDMGAEGIMNKRDVIKQSLSYGWIVFLCSMCAITGLLAGWGIHRAVVNISGENMGMLAFAFNVYEAFDNPTAFVMAFVSLGGLVLQFIRTFRGRRNND